MRFKNITIPAEGRNKYGNYMSSSELQKSVVRVTYNGNNTTGGNDPKKPQEEQKDIYTLFLSRSVLKFESKKLLEGNVTENIDVLGFVNNFTGDTFVGNIDTIPTEDIEKNNDHYDIVGVAEKGMSIYVADNGTKRTQIQITCTSAATENAVRSGTLIVPCSVYKKSGDIDLGPYIADWASEKENCYTLYLEIQWEISALPSSNAYTLELTNEIAGINCDSKGNIYPNAVRPTCQAIMYYGTEEVTDATYGISIDESRNAQGVTINTSTGELTFSSNFTFDGTTLEVRVTGNANGAQISKVMSIVKQYPGADGTPSTTRWLVPSVNSIKFNPNTEVITPSSVSCKVMKQVGEEAPVEDTDTIIYYGYNPTINPITPYTEPVSPDKTKDYLVFALKNGNNDVYEIETIQIIKDGIKGDKGEQGEKGEQGAQGEQGRKGPALRGPVDWKNQTTSRRWCNGVFNKDYPEDAEYIDIVVYNGVYYVCIVSYEGAGSEINAPSSTYWKATDKQYEFIATNLLMAENAKINFQTSNELYLMDSNGNVTAGAAGGDGINFWAGANEPGNGAFKVYNNGTMEATKGKFGLLEIGTDDLGNGILYGTNTNIDGGTNNISIQPQKFEMNSQDENGNVSKSVTIAQDPDYMDDRGVVVVELNTAEDNGIYTNAMVEAEGYTKSINNHQFFTPFSPVNNLEITFVTDTNYFTKSNGFWVWRGMYLGRVSTTTYPYIIENSDGEWCFSPTNTQTTAGFVRSGIYTSKHIKQNNRLYIVI